MMIEMVSRVNGILDERFWRSSSPTAQFGDAGDDCQYKFHQPVKGWDTGRSLYCCALCPISALSCRVYPRWAVYL